MPADKGRQMLGVIDETFSLEYGQVFVQYSKNIDNPTVSLVLLAFFEKKKIKELLWGRVYQWNNEK